MRMRGVTKRTAVAAFALALVAAVSGPASAQVSTGEIFGRVTDATGAVLPGATVTIASAALIQAQTVATSASGGYRFPQIPIGTYTGTFDLTGFKKLVCAGGLIRGRFNARIKAKAHRS